MSSRIEQIIEEIEEYIDSCKFQPLSTTKIIVNKDQMDELLRELRMKTPDEIKRYQKIIANKDAILADARAKAESIIGHTLDSYTTKYDGLVNSLRECYDIVRTNRAELEIPDKSDRGMEAEFGVDLIEE